jgi:hypothetical protein
MQEFHVRHGIAASRSDLGFDPVAIVADVKMIGFPGVKDRDTASVVHGETDHFSRLTHDGEASIETIEPLNELVVGQSRGEATGKLLTPEQGVAFEGLPPDDGLASLVPKLRLTKGGHYAHDAYYSESFGEMKSPHTLPG